MIANVQLQLPIQRQDSKKIDLDELKQRSKLQNAGYLIIHLLSASNLKAADLNGKSDPYCILSMGDKSLKSEIQKKTLNPNWDQTFHFDIDDKENTLVDFEVFDWDRFSKSDFLGKCTLSTHVLQDFVKTDITLPLNTQGTITFFATFIPSNNVGVIVRRCAELNTKYTDLDFDVRKDEIIGDPEFKKSLNFHKWVRTSELCESRGLKPELFVKGIEPADIRQGQIGDCYFLGAVAVLASQPQLVKNLFNPPYYSEYGVYEIKLFWKGKWRHVIIDDYVAIGKDGTPTFAHSIDYNETWAYAKLVGSYQAIVSGSIREAFEVVTGGFADSIDMSKVEKKEMLFYEMLSLKRRNGLMACSTIPDADLAFDIADDPQPNEKGIVPCHAYSILNVKEIEGYKLIKLRNTWGRFEWTGDWCDNDTKHWTPSIKKALHYVNSDDGQFWMSFTDFIKEFKYLYVCRVPPIQHIVSIDDEWSKEKDNCGGFIKLRHSFFKNPQYQLIVPEGKTRLFISIQLDEEPSKDDKKNPVGLYVFKNDSTRRIFKMPREGCIAKTEMKKLFRDGIELNLEKDKYPYIVIPCHWYPDTENKFRITVNSTRAVIFRKIPLKDDWIETKINGEWLGDNNYGPHWQIQIFNKNPLFLIDPLGAKSIFHLHMKVKDKSVPWFPYLVKGAYKDKIDNAKYVKEEYCVLFPKNGKEFYSGEGMFHGVLDPNEGPFILVVSSAKKINPRPFSITIRTENRVKVDVYQIPK